jgi:RimJ/RimL family protein N-acetyltransferase
MNLAREEIGIKPRRLDSHETYLIYSEGRRVGCVSFRFEPEQTIYLYILAFAREAQRQGFAAGVLEWVMEQGREKAAGFRGLATRIHRSNETALRAAKKHGFRVTGKRPKYFDFLKPAPGSEGERP